MNVNIKATGRGVVISDIVRFYPTGVFFIYTRLRVCLVVCSLHLSHLVLQFLFPGHQPGAVAYNISRLFALFVLQLHVGAYHIFDV